MKKDINELKEKIIGSAEKEAEDLLSRAKKVEKRIIIQAREEEKKIKEEADKKGKSLFDKEKMRINSKKKNDEKKEFFSLRNKLFELLHNDLEEMLVLMLKTGKLDDWVKSCCEQVIKEEEKVTLVARKEDLRDLKKICNGLNGLDFAHEPIAGGFLIRSKENEYDFRFSVLSSNILRQNIKMVADKLGVKSG
jgi:vacuolar-type H+-ATPase subunit E/Vma4